MQQELQDLVDLLDLEEIERNHYRGQSADEGWQRVYGGQVLGQALVAAARTVESGRNAHSMHAYFLRPGAPAHPILYVVDRIRDGRSFTTRRVVAVQDGQAIFSMAISFQVHEEGFSHQIDPPDVPPPEELVDEHELRRQHMAELPEAYQHMLTRKRPIEARPVTPWNMYRPEPREPVQICWMRTTDRLPDDPRLHQCALAYLSDWTLLDTAFYPHAISFTNPGLISASLDHAMWFHRDFRADDWLLYVQDSPSASGARGLTRGTIFRRDGTLVASVAQEGLMRLVE